MEHITINVRDLDVSIAFYTNVLGLTIVNDIRGKIGQPIVFLTSDARATNLELIENTQEPYNGTGLSLGFHVKDVQVSHKDMTTKGLNPSPIISPAPGMQFFFITDPDGVKIQLF